MKKLLLTLALASILVFSAAADANSATTNMRVSAYKEDPMPDLDYVFKVSYQGNTEITGVTSIFDISDKVTKETTLWKVGNAFQIEIQSSYLTTTATLTFFPFINQKDTSRTLPVSYTLAAANYYYTDSSPKYTASYRSGGLFSSTYYYRYFPKLTLTTSGMEVTTVTVSDTPVVATLTQSIDYVQRSTRTNSNYQTVTGSDIPSSTNGKIVGVTNNPRSIGRFHLNISGEDYEEMAANVDYIATVKVEITQN